MPPVTRLPSRDPFGVLVAAAANDAEAALALAAAYGPLPIEERRRFLEVVIAGAAREDVSALGPLALLLSVEEDASLAAVIRDALLAEETSPELRDSEKAPAGYAAGDEDEGAVAVVRPLHGPFVELVAIAHGPGGITQTVVEPLLRSDGVERALRDLPVLSEFPVEFAQERLVETLWRHLRAGGQALPEGLAALL